MATSSIFANFDIRDKKTAENFVSALDASAHETAWQPIAHVQPPLTDKDAIRILWAKRVEKMN